MTSSYPPRVPYIVSPDSDESEHDNNRIRTHDPTHNASNLDRSIPPIPTPSPTPSEKVELAKTSVVDWKALINWRYWIRKEWTWYYLMFIVCLVGVILFTVYHKQIVHWLRPAADWMHELPFGWTIPIAILFIISFPPLFGHEIVAILCGLVWGLGVGFAIVAAGTFLGELGNFYAFKWCCSARGEKLERTRPTYAYLARVVRDGGFKIALIARLSAIPGHFTTAVFSTCGMGLWTFSLAAFLSLPKQFITVYLGVALEQSEDGESSTKDTIIKDVVLGVTTIITIGAMYYIYDQMNKAKPKVIYDRCRARKHKLQLQQGSKPYGNSAVLDSTTSVTYNPAASYAEIPLNPSQHNQPTVYAPQPRRPAPPPSSGDYPLSDREYDDSPETIPAPRAGHNYPPPTTSPPSDPFGDSARVQTRPPLPSQLQPGISYQRQAPPRGYGSPPRETFSRAQKGAAHPDPARGVVVLQQTRAPSAPYYPSETSQTPNAPYRPPTASPPPPPRAPLPNPSRYAYPRAEEGGRDGEDGDGDARNPFSDPRTMPEGYYGAEQGGERLRYGGHGVEATDATFYTAVAHSREGTEEGLLEESGAPPPSYTSHERWRG